MKSLAAAFMPIKAWQAGALVVALVGSGALSFTLTGGLESADAVRLGDNQQLLPVQVGNLVNSVSINGSLLFPERETLRFPVAGVVGEVFVEEGDRVGAGEDLAALDAATLAALEEALASARTRLRDAEDALADAHIPYTPLEIEEGEANLAQARLNVHIAEDTLAAAAEPYSDQQLRSQEAAIARARADLQAAEEALADAESPFTAQDVRAKQEAIAAARVKIQAAQEALDQANQPATAGAIVGAEAGVDRSRRELDAVRTTELDVRNAQEQLLEDTEAALDAKTADYRQALGTIRVTGDPNLIAVGLEGISDQEIFLDPDALQAKYPPGLTPVTVPAQVRQAWTQLIEARFAFEAALDGQAIIEAQRAVTQGEQAIQDAEDALSALLAPPDPLDIELKEAELSSAEEGLAQAQQALADVLAGADSVAVALQRAQVATAEAVVAEAEATLADMLAGADPLEVADKQQELALALAKRTGAEDRLADLNAGPDALDVALREAELATARAALGTAAENLDGVVLRAPFSGVVNTLAIEPGDQINPTAAAVEIVDTSIVEVDGVVDEIDVLFVQVRSEAQVIMDALQGEALVGEVSSIATSATTQQGVVSFPIRIRVEVPESVELREGLSAVAQVVLRESTDVLLIPSVAVTGSFLQPTVIVESNGDLIERPVTLGDSDDFFVVVHQGLREGDMVLVESGTGDASIFGFGFGGAQGQAFRELFAGGFRRGGQGGGQGGAPAR